MNQKHSLTFICFIAVLFGSATVLAAKGPALSGSKAEAGDVYEVKYGPLKPLGARLIELYQSETSARFGLRAKQLTPADPTVRTQGGRVLIDAVAATNGEALLVDLRGLGLQHGSVYERVVSGWLPIAALNEMAQLDSLQFARPAAATAKTGAVTSQGDAAMQTDVARFIYNVDGSGVRVGVMSDSYNCRGGAAAGVVSGDLPQDMIVLAEGPCPASDEGRAMVEIIHDIAPAAAQAFHTAFNGQADFANGIIELATVADSEVIVDDIIYFAEPMFQDGIINQAIDQVVAGGAAYFSAAGNNERQAFVDSFRPSGVTGAFGGMRHDFDPGPGVDDLQTIILGTGTTIFSFQWDQPYFSVSGPPGSASDMDVLLYINGNFIGLGGFAINLGGDPIEVFGVSNSGPPVPVEIGLELFAGPQPGTMKYVYFGPASVAEWATHSGTLYGHANAAGAEAVGAARYDHTPEFGVTPAEIEPFSSAGFTPILFDQNGNRLAEPVVRLKPEIVAPDGGNNTFFGFDYEGDGFPNFFGTSAAAPHAAGLAALMLDTMPTLPPQELYSILELTAEDMDDPATPGFDFGFDFGTGNGLVDGPSAVVLAPAIGHKILVCHKNRKTLSVSQHALAAHLRHGDSLGVCN